MTQEDGVLWEDLLANNVDKQAHIGWTPPKEDLQMVDDAVQFVGVEDATNGGVATVVTMEETIIEGCQEGSNVKGEEYTPSEEGEKYKKQSIGSKLLKIGMPL